MTQVGLCGQLGVNPGFEDCRAENAEHMSKRPFSVPLAETSTCGLRRWQFVTFSNVPQADHALPQPHPRRQLFDALAAPVLRGLNLHHLLARFEGDLNR